MDGKLFVVFVISIVSLISGGLSWSIWLSHQERMHQMDVALQLSQQETHRLEIVTRRH